MEQEITSDEVKYLIKIGEKLKELRKSKRLTLKQVSSKIHIRASDISKYENGEKKSLSILTLNKFCNLYNIKLYTFLYKCDESASNTYLDTLLLDLRKYNNAYYKKINSLIQDIENLKLK